jgi:integrase
MTRRYTREHVRKVCGCPRKRWSKCRHPWHFAYFHHRPFRFSLDRYLQKHPESWSDARDEAAKIVIAIHAGAFSDSLAVVTPEPVTATPGLTFASFAEIWHARVGAMLVSGPLHAYRLGTIKAFVLASSGATFGEQPVAAITLEDIETFREARKTAGLSAVSVNHDLKLLRSMFNWGVRKGYLERTPFKVGGVATVTLDREIPRHRRFESADDETRLLDAAGPHLRAVITAVLDTACRPGEILGLQWGAVSLERREFVIQAEREKTRRSRLVPISRRLMAILELRRDDPAGRPFPATAYVFGDAIGGQVKSVREEWIAASIAAGLVGFQLRDLRHESACRFEEAGTPVSDVSKLLGHSSLTTTSRYLMNMQRRALRRAVDRLEQRFANDLQTDGKTDASKVAEPAEPEAQKPSIS